jgi:predicted TPR repeat methyltransferase
MEAGMQDPDQVRELSIDQALLVAVELHRLRERDNAERLYRRILEVAPHHSEALHFLGVLLHQRGRSVQALGLIRKSIALDPAPADPHNNLGNVLLELDRPHEAADAYRAAIARVPGHADACNNLGAALRVQGQPEAARAAYLKAIACDPQHVEAHNNLGNLLAGIGETEQALAYYCKAITLMPGHPQARKLLGIAYSTLGQGDKAAQVFGEWLAAEPGNPVAQHLYAACSGQQVPERASDAYIESTFDGFAASFDAKLGKLGYRAPQLLADALARACGEPAARLAILDAGCGTGLCGPLLAPYTARLVGIDLSRGMLERAASRAIYDHLEKAELQAWLAAHSGEFDVVASADTLVYFGALEGVLGAARRALKAGGLLLFTLEAGAGDAAGYRINPHGRYSHDDAYVRRSMAQAGFGIEAIDAADLRQEGGKPVAGWVVCGRAAPPSAPCDRSIESAGRPL